jgi:hypothetical protein
VNVTHNELSGGEDEEILLMVTEQVNITTDKTERGINGTSILVQPVMLLVVETSYMTIRPVAPTSTWSLAMTSSVVLRELE